MHLTDKATLSNIVGCIYYGTVYERTKLVQWQVGLLSLLRPESH